MKIVTRLPAVDGTAWTHAAVRGLIGQRSRLGPDDTAGYAEVVDAYLDPYGTARITLDLPLTVTTRALTADTIGVSIGYDDPPPPPRVDMTKVTNLPHPEQP